LGERADIKAIISPLVNGEALLIGVETFNKPARWVPACRIIKTLPTSANLRPIC
jgi:hypothetical protein